MKDNKKNILVTGGSGFIGTNLIIKLISLGYEVASFDERPPHIKVPGCQYIIGDMKNFRKDMTHFVLKNSFNVSDTACPCGIL